MKFKSLMFPNLINEPSHTYHRNFLVQNITRISLRQRRLCFILSCTTGIFKGPRQGTNPQFFSPPPSSLPQLRKEFSFRRGETTLCSLWILQVASARAGKQGSPARDSGLGDQNWLAAESRLVSMVVEPPFSSSVNMFDQPKASHQSWPAHPSLSL